MNYAISPDGIRKCQRLIQERDSRGLFKIFIQGLDTKLGPFQERDKEAASLSSHLNPIWYLLAKESCRLTIPSWRLRLSSFEGR